MNPVNILIDVTHNCNSRCKCCDAWRYKSCDELSSDKIMFLLGSLKDYLGSYAATFSGGEPTLRNDLEEILSFCKDEKITSCLVSNGLLIDKPRAKSIIESGVDHISISLDSLEPKTYSYIRGREVSLVINGISYSNEIRGNTSLSILTLLVEQNLSEIPELVDYVLDENLSRINFQVLVEKFHSKNSTLDIRTEDIWPKDKLQIEDVFNWLIQAKRKSLPISNSVEQLKLMKRYYEGDLIGANCAVGENTIVINPFGEVKLCYWMESIGNMMNQSLGDILDSRIAMRIREKISQCKKPCWILNCNYGPTLERL